MSSERRSAVDRLVETVSSWPGVTTREGRFDSTVFELAGREVGHVHRWGPVDIAYPGPIRDRLVAEGRTGPHHVVPASNATTFRVESVDDVDEAVTLLRISCLCRASSLRAASGDEGPVEPVDVEAELRGLDLSDELRAVVSRTVGAG